MSTTSQGYLPDWRRLVGSKGITTGVAVAGGISPNAVLTTGSYDDPSWIIGLSGSKIDGGTATPDAVKSTVFFAGAATESAIGSLLSTGKGVAIYYDNDDEAVSGVVRSYDYDTATDFGYGATHWRVLNILAAGVVILVNGTSNGLIIDHTGLCTGTAFAGPLTGDVTGNVSGNAGTVTNGVYTTGSYSNPSWITALAGSKITGTVSADGSKPIAILVRGASASAIGSVVSTGHGLTLYYDDDHPTISGVIQAYDYDTATDFGYGATHWRFMSILAAGVGIYANGTANGLLMDHTGMVLFTSDDEHAIQVVSVYGGSRGGLSIDHGVSGGNPSILFRVNGSGVDQIFWNGRLIVDSHLLETDITGNAATCDDFTDNGVYKNGVNGSINIFTVTTIDVSDGQITGWS